MSQSLQLCALSGCSPPAWCSRSEPSKWHLLLWLSSKTCISTSLRQCLSNRRCTLRRSCKRYLCSSVLWLQFWRGLQGSQGGETCMYLGLVSLTKAAAFLRPPLVVRSKPLCNPIDIARPPCSRTAQHNGLSHGAQTSNRSKLEPWESSWTALIPLAISSWRGSQILDLKLLVKIWDSSAIPLLQHSTGDPETTASSLSSWLSKWPVWFKLPLKTCVLVSKLSWWSCP